MVLISDGKESRIFFCGVATKRGGGVRALPLRKKIFFEALLSYFKTKHEGVEGKAMPLKIIIFLRLPQGRL